VAGEQGKSQETVGLIRGPRRISSGPPEKDPPQLGTSRKARKNVVWGRKKKTAEGANFHTGATEKAGHEPIVKQGGEGRPL